MDPHRQPRLEVVVTVVVSCVLQVVPPVGARLKGESEIEIIGELTISQGAPDVLTSKQVKRFFSIVVSDAYKSTNCGPGLGSSLAQHFASNDERQGQVLGCVGVGCVSRC